jgi:hypothetical protein
MKKGRIFLLTVSMGSGGAERQMRWLKAEPSLEIEKIICLSPGTLMDCQMKTCWF